MPPCMGDADRFSLEALRHIHKQLDDDNDGGIEVNESVEVSAAVSEPANCHVSLKPFLATHSFEGRVVKLRCSWGMPVLKLVAGQY